MALLAPPRLAGRAPANWLSETGQMWDAPMTPRVSNAVDADLLVLRARVSEMGGLAEEQLSRALDAVRRRDLPLARSIVAADAELDRRERALEELSIRTLALRQPLAQDLRETIAALKIASTLERIGDLAKSVARRAAVLAERRPSRIETGVLRLGQLAQTQLADVLDAYGARDTPAALEIWRRDIGLDELHNSLMRDLLAEMSHEPHQLNQNVQLMFIAKNIERVGDHATFIAEMTYYVVTGHPIVDQRPKGDPLFPLPDDLSATRG